METPVNKGFPLEFFYKIFLILLKCEKQYQ